MSDALKQLSEQGVAVWLDDLSRGRITSGSLARLVERSHVVGVTTNPSIFEKSLTTDDHYQRQLAELALHGATAEAAVRTLTTADVRAAADLLRATHEATGGRDGWVSLEVDPRLAHRTAETVAEALELRRLVDRPNVLIKIPATVEGLPAITEVIAEGISVNVTLIFSLDRYKAVTDAYQTGLERAETAGLELSGIHSVASFFVSRMDTEVDQRLDKLGTEAAAALRGRAALANARLAYQAYQHVLASPRWHTLERGGANRQRPLWASTGVKNPDYDDTRYVVDLVAPETVNTMPEATLHAVADHGVVTGDSITGHYEESWAVFHELARLGVSYDEVVATLEREGVEKFEQAWGELLRRTRAELDRLVTEGA